MDQLCEVIRFANNVFIMQIDSEYLSKLITRISIIFLFYCFIYPSSVTGQNVSSSLSGSIAVKKGKKLEPLPGASIVLLSLPDSSHVKGVVSNKLGYFVFSNVPMGKNYCIKISHTSYVSIFKNVTVLTPRRYLVGTIEMQEKSIELSEVVVTPEQSTITQKGDTVLINTLDYKIRRGAYAGDLVKRISGLYYDSKNGSLTYNGLDIEEVNVNGEVFFGGNIKQALDNLPADMISRIKVYNKRSKADIAGGIDRGLEHYVIDLQTKKKFEGSIISSGKVGIGSNHKKSADLISNYFDSGGENFSISASMDNLNQNTTYDKNRTDLGALSVSHKFSPKISLNGNLQYKREREGRNSSAYTQNILSNNTQYTNSADESINTNKNLSGNVDLSYILNPRTQINFNVLFYNNKLHSHASSHAATFNAPPLLSLQDPFRDIDKVDKSIRVNDINARTSNRNKTDNYNVNFSINRKLSDKGVILTLGASMDYSHNESQNDADTRTIFYGFQKLLGHKDSLLVQHRSVLSPRRINSWIANATLVVPWSDKMQLQTFYSYTDRQEHEEGDTFDLINGNSIKIDSLNNASRSSLATNQIGVRFIFNNHKWNINASLSADPQKRRLKRRVGYHEVDTALRYCNFTPVLRLSWIPTKENRLSLTYSGYSNNPMLGLLVPITDNTNPLFVRKGNPALQRSFNHNLRMEFQDTKKSLFVNLNYRLEKNSIVQSVYLDTETGTRITMPVNLDGNWWLGGDIRWQKRWQKFILSLYSTGSIADRVGLIANESLGSTKNKSRIANIRSQFRLSYQPLWGSIEIMGATDYTKSINNAPYRRSFTTVLYDLGVDAFADLPFNLQLRTDMAYQIRKGSFLQGNTDNLLWNLGLSWNFLKANNAELAVYWADVLGRNRNFIRQSSSDGIYESYVQTIAGYVMISFKININRFK